MGDLVVYRAQSTQQTLDAVWVCASSNTHPCKVRE